VLGYSILYIYITNVIYIYILESWLPNLLDNDNNDFHTGYVTHISFIPLHTTTPNSYVLTLRYSKFKKIYTTISKYSNEYITHSVFPSTTISQFIMGVSNELRFERMHAFDSWLREVIVSPVLMTIKEVVEVVYEVLEVHEHVPE
jgi:hypothetical protein